MVRITPVLGRAPPTGPRGGSTVPRGDGDRALMMSWRLAAAASSQGRAVYRVYSASSGPQDILQAHVPQQQRQQRQQRQQQQQQQQQQRRRPRVALEDVMEDEGVRIIVVREPHEAAAAYAALVMSLHGHDRAVGVDCEGVFGKGQPALMIQVASPTVVVVETPRPASQLSAPLRALLEDSDTVKAFYAAKGDLDAIVCAVSGISDVADMIPAAQKRGGLVAAIAFADPEQRQWTKQSFSKRGWWRLKTADAYLREPGFVRYAAADAWGTLRGYSWLRSAAVRPLEVHVESAAKPQRQRQQQPRQLDALTAQNVGRKRKRCETESNSVGESSNDAYACAADSSCSDNGPETAQGHVEATNRLCQQPSQQTPNGFGPTYVCSTCHAAKPRAVYSNTMLRRRKSIMRCKQCVAASLPKPVGRGVAVTV